MKMTADDLEERWQLKNAFPRGNIGDALAERALRGWDAASGDDRYRIAQQASRVAAYASHVFAANAYSRHGDLSEWFGLPDRDFNEIESEWNRLRGAWRASSEEDDQAAEEEHDRVMKLEDDGAYGRTMAWSEGLQNSIFIRFGGMPRIGRSVFGLAREDLEDCPDPWRQELGNLTHEAGMSVFAAMRHPDVPGAYILLEPHFDLARYNVAGRDSHLLAVIPDPANGTDYEALLVSGDLASTVAFDGTRRLELGSDGEFLIRNAVLAEPLAMDHIWYDRTTKLADFLEGRRYREPSPHNLR